MQVYDISAEDGPKPSFEFVQSAQYWEVPIAGQGQPENPVPAADGSTYQVHSHSHSHSQYWEVPIAGQGQPEKPVPAADGTTYQVLLVSLQTCIFYHHVCVIKVLTYQVCLFSCGRPVVHGKLQWLLA